MRRLCTLPLDDVLVAIRNQRGKMTITHEGEKVTVSLSASRRLKTYLKGTSCVHCGIEAHYFAVEQGPRWHLNLYHLKENGKEVMMTSDHIVPKAKGGTDGLHNRQPMCQPCNNLKADYDSVEQALENKKKKPKKAKLRRTANFFIKKLLRCEQVINKAYENLDNQGKEHAWSKILDQTIQRREEVLSQLEDGYRLPKVEIYEKMLEKIDSRKASI